MAYIFKIILLKFFVTQCLAEYYGGGSAWNDYDPRFYNYIWRQNKALNAGKGFTKPPLTPTKQKTQATRPTTRPTIRTTARTTTATTRVRDLSRTYFQSLESYSVEATPIPETRYPWIAKVVHSRNANYPYVCTAVCVEARIFITAGRCLANLKLILTTVIYQKYRFPAEVFVLPSEPTKQMYDDIGIIVVERNDYKGKWFTIQVFNGRRTDDKYQWFSDLNLHNLGFHHKAIGYVIKKAMHRFKTPNMEYDLSEVNVLIDIQMCSDILSKGIKASVQSFFVPCYHTCNMTQYRKKAVECRKFLGTEGAAVLNVKTNKLLGVATWGTTSNALDLPVGFAVANSDNYLKDLECARKIKNDEHFNNAYRGYFQSLCVM